MTPPNPYRAQGADYVCGRCGHLIPEGARVHAGTDGDELVWVQALNGDGETVHECGEVPHG